MIIENRKRLTYKPIRYYEELSFDHRLSAFVTRFARDRASKTGIWLLQNFLA